MKLPRHQVRMLTNRRGLRTLTGQALIAFGLLSAIVQLYTGIWGSDAVTWRWQTALAVVTLSLAYGVWRAWPPARVSRDFVTPSMQVSVVVGDLFERSEHLVVGFSDTFDTDITADEVISSRSVQGQLLTRLYGNNLQSLDDDLQRALAGAQPVGLELRTGKQKGKLQRYPIGTVAVLAPRTQKIFAVAYSRLGND